MGITSTAIEKAVSALKASPGTFQRLVESYAQIVYPGLFGQLVPAGRRADDVAVKGWPDAWSQLPNGKFAIIEATHSDSWQRHLRADVDKTESLSSETLGAFLFCSWAKSPDAESLKPFRAGLMRAGLAQEHIFFLFREQLIRDLAQPRFARLWVELLGLMTCSLPFRLITDSGELYGSAEQRHAFVPTRSEYERGLVHRPALAELIERRLAEVGWALVSGRGAAGKTVLATSIAYARYHPRPVHYLDLTTWREEQFTSLDAVQALVTSGDVGVLFIIDNIHLQPRVAQDLLDAWRETSANGSHLLLLGRKVTPEPDHKGRVSLLPTMYAEALDLLAEPKDLLGVYRRIVLRSMTVEPPTPPASAVESWTKLFVGDLRGCPAFR